MKKKILKNIYKTFIDDSYFTIKMSGTITVALLIVYAVFAFILNEIGDLYNLNVLGYVMFLICISLTLSLVTPFFYSFFAITGGLHSPRADSITYKSFLKTYFLGRRPPFKNILSVWRNLIDAFLVYILTEFAVGLIISLIAISTKGELNTFFVDLYRLLSTEGSTQALNSLLEKHEVLIGNIQMGSNFVALLFSTYFFLHSIVTNSFKYYVAPMLLNAPSRTIDYVFKKGLKNHRKEYYEGYYLCALPSLILFLIGFFGSYFLLYYLGAAHLDINILSLTSIVVGSILGLPFIPIIFNYHEKIWPKFSQYFLEFFLESATKELNIYKSQVQKGNEIDRLNIETAEKNLKNISDEFKKGNIFNFKDEDVEDEKKDDLNDSSSDLDSTNNVDSKEETREENKNNESNSTNVDDDTNDNKKE